MSSAAGGSGQDGGRRHAAGAFDVRNVIAGLIGAYGVVLIVVGLVGNSAADQRKTGGVDANLWAGIVMLVVGVVFALWSRLRPVVVDPGDVERADEDDRPAH